jgi:hypothetical protein
MEATLGPTEAGEEPEICDMVVPAISEIVPTVKDAVLTRSQRLTTSIQEKLDAFPPKLAPFKW